jgi:hypothetical protein
MENKPMERLQSSTPVTGVIPLEQMAGDDEKDTALLREMADRAEKFLASFAWCGSIAKSFFGDGIGNIAAVFLFHIVPAQPSVDEWLWVVVGDIPSAYLVLDRCKTPAEALKTYIKEMRRWAELAQKGRESPDVIPVNAPATPEWAEHLSGRLKILESLVLPHFESSGNTQKPSRNSKS